MEGSVEQVFVRYYAELKRAVNPDDIAAELFAKGVITGSEKAEVDHVMFTVAFRMDKLLSAVQRAIRVDDNNFHIFLEVLDAIPKYKNLVRTMKATLQAGDNVRDTYPLGFSEPSSPIRETSPLQVMLPLPQPTEPLAITTQPESLNVQWGSEAVLSCRAKGPPGQMVSYQWYKGVKALPSENSGDLRIPQVTCEDEGKYNCVVSCGEKKINSEYVDIHVQQLHVDPQATGTTAMDAQCSTDLILEIAQLSFDWRSVGSHLIGAQHVSDIDREEHDEQTRWGRMRMLTTWLQQEGSKATYRHLVEALKKLENKVAVEEVTRLVMEDPQATETTAMDAQCSTDLILEIAQLPFDWRSVGSHLIGAQHVSDIDREEHNEQNRWGRMRMLSTWLQQEGSKATYRHLVDALEKLENKVAVEEVTRLVMEDPQATETTAMDAQCSTDLILEIAQLPFDWRSVGSHLIGAQHVSDIDREEHDEQNRSGRMRMLSTWLQQEGSKATYRHLVEALEKLENKVAVEEVTRLVMEGPKFQHWGGPVPRQVLEKKDHPKLQLFMSTVEVILLARDAFSKAAVLEDLKPPLDEFTNHVSFPTRDIFLGIFAGKKTSLFFVGTSCRSVTKALEHYFPQATTVVALSVSSTTAGGMNGDIVVPSTKSKYVHGDWDCVCGMNLRKSVIHAREPDPFVAEIQAMESVFGIITFAISGISTNNTWTVTAAKVAADYCKVFLSTLQDVPVPIARKNQYFTSINIKRDSPTLSSLYYLLSMLNEDVQKVVIEHCSKAMYTHRAPDDDNYSDVLTCITRIIKWAKTAEDNSWNSLISVLRKYDLNIAADEIEKNAALILRYMSLAEAAFLLSDEDHSNAKTDSESLYKELITQGIEKDITIAVQINEENQLYYPQYVISVEVSDFDEFEKRIHRAAKIACIHTPIIVVQGVQKFMLACAPGSKMYTTNVHDYGSLGCFLEKKPGFNLFVSTCEHCRDDVEMIVKCDSSNKIKVDYMTGIRSETADICLLQVRSRMQCYRIVNEITDVVNDRKVTLNKFQRPEIGDAVIKQGARTGYSEMVIKCNVEICNIDGRVNKNCWKLVHQGELDNVIAGEGDSGSVVVKPDTVDNNIVGILFATRNDGKEALMFDFEQNLKELVTVQLRHRHSFSLM